MATDTTPTIRERHEASVREQWRQRIATMARRRSPPSTIPATRSSPRGEIFDGASEVQSFYDENYGAFPDFSVTIEHTHHAEESVAAEGTITGTHLGAYRGLPPTGRSVRWPYCAAFVFEQDRLLSERFYFDLGTLLRQLGVGRDPNSIGGKIEMTLAHPVTFARALLHQRTRR
jgi:steroid delta-isomerase-like uncharacterized protein